MQIRLQPGWARDPNGFWLQYCMQGDAGLGQASRFNPFHGSFRLFALGSRISLVLVLSCPVLSCLGPLAFSVL